jgi:ABC-type multidrug transport system ATPase subunit
MSISVKNVTKLYGQQKALDNVSFEVGSNESVGFLGPNGAGKSTMMKIITSFIPATILSTGMYAFLTSAAGIRISMTSDKTLLVGSLTMGVCAASAAIAIRKLRDADPASVF